MITFKKKISIPNFVFKFILVLWFVFSVFYVAWGEWTRFKVSVMEESYNHGVVDTVASVIDKSNATCDAIPITLDETTVFLVNQRCLNVPERPKASN